MTISDAIHDTWRILREEKYVQPGTYERRIFAASGFSLFAALERPANLPQIHFHFLTSLKDAIPVIELRGVSLKNEPLLNGCTRLRLELVHSSFEEIFATLVVDVLSKVLATSSEKQALEILILRLIHWQKFMQVSGPEGLSQTRQAGLFGELTVLRSLLKEVGASDEILASWQGPKAKNQDFYINGHALEVKTSTTNLIHTVTISNEHQLDSDGLLSLSLCHLCLDVRDGAGISLPVLIADIQSLLKEELALDFADLLFKAGYLENQRHLYVVRGYVERRRNYYSIAEGFPRILPIDLMPGIEKVEYQLNLGVCAGFRISESQAISFFAGDTE